MTNLLEKLPRLALPPVEGMELKESGGVVQVYDRLRRRWVVLTPEEWVRQNFVGWLVGELGYPASRTANEVALKQINRQRRADTVVYDQTGKPYIVVEYKRPSVEITQKVFDQIARYNSVLGAPLLIVSNGIHHYCCRFTVGTAGAVGYEFLREIPCYGQ